MTLDLVQEFVYDFYLGNSFYTSYSVINYEVIFIDLHYGYRPYLCITFNGSPQNVPPEKVRLESYNNWLSEKRNHRLELIGII